MQKKYKFRLLSTAWCVTTWLFKPHKEHMCKTEVITDSVEPRVPLNQLMDKKKKAA